VTVIETIMWVLWVLYCAFIVGLMIYFSIIEPLYRGIRKIIRTLNSGTGVRSEDNQKMPSTRDAG
jgi:hypothetical protein